MTGRSILRGNRHPTRPLSVIALWIALLVALASSLLSGGLPRTTALGSAFNPATTIVALKPVRPAPRILIDAVRRDDGPAAGASDVALVASLASRPTSVAVARTPWFVALAAIPLRPRAVLDGSPRGPPIT